MKLEWIQQENEVVDYIIGHFERSIYLSTNGIWKIAASIPAGNSNLSFQHVDLPRGFAYYNNIVDAMDLAQRLQDALDYQPGIIAIPSDLD
jgi:hypothetical protein